MPLVLLLAVCAPTPALSSPEAARALVQGIEKHGRAEVGFVRSALDAWSGKTVSHRGRLVLESPGRARITFDDSGERVTLRPDGGEWLQPSLSQLVRLRRSDAAPALRWWTLFTGGDAAGFGERRLAVRRFRLAPAGGAGDSVDVTLDSRGLPVEIRLDEGSGQRATYRFDAWRFTRAIGRGDFVIAPPAGYEVFDMPGGAGGS